MSCLNMQSLLYLIKYAVICIHFHNINLNIVFIEGILDIIHKSENTVNSPEKKTQSHFILGSL